MAIKDNSDPILNVYGYLRSQMGQAAGMMSAAAQELEQHSRQLDKNRQGIDELMDMLRQLGVPEETLSGVRADPKDYYTPPEPFQVTVPADFDFQKKFDEYLARAREAGFVDVQIEELLTAEELASAEARNRKVDQLFSAATELRDWDLLVVSVGVLLHILRAILFRQKQLRTSVPAAQPLPEDPAPVQPEGQATAGISLSPGQILSSLPFRRTVTIKDVDAILHDTPSFRQVSDQRYGAGEFLGNDMLWGWIVGVFNILTDTVTVRNMQTFQPLVDESSHFRLSQEQLPFIDLFLPFADKGLKGIQDQMVASVIREAYVLVPNEADFSNVDQLFRRNRQSMELAASALDAASSISPLEIASDTLQSAGWSNLINVLLIAVHNLFNKAEEDPGQYMVRTMKVITLANAIGATVGSLPAILAQDYWHLDYGGAVSTVLNAAGLTQVMIDAKTEFLVSHYLPQVQDEIRSLDQYFKTE